MDRVEAWAPGRVNLLGEHTDYAGGLVLPLPIDRGTRVTALRSERLEFPPQAERYVRAVLDELGLREGVRLEIEGDLPIGAGLASSASLTVACAKALVGLFGLGLDEMAVAQACRRAEHAVGVRCGIMDPVAASCWRPGAAIYLDCSSLERRAVAMPEVAVVVAHTGIRHELAESAYNERVAKWSVVPEWREHVESENARVRDGVRLLEEKDLAGFGRLMYASHKSLRDRYRVSCLELDTLVDALAQVAWGAKMTGAGFGGAVVALADPECAEDAVERARTAGAREVFVCGPAAPKPVQ